MRYAYSSQNSNNVGRIFGSAMSFAPLKSGAKSQFLLQQPSGHHDAVDRQTLLSSLGIGMLLSRPETVNNKITFKPAALCNIAKAKYYASYVTIRFSGVCRGHRQTLNGERMRSFPPICAVVMQNEYSFGECLLYYYVVVQNHSCSDNCHVVAHSPAMRAQPAG